MRNDGLKLHFHIMCHIVLIIQDFFYLSIFVQDYYYFTNL